MGYQRDQESMDGDHRILIPLLPLNERGMYTSYSATDSAVNLGEPIIELNK